MFLFLAQASSNASSNAVTPFAVPVSNLQTTLETTVIPAEVPSDLVGQATATATQAATQAGEGALNYLAGVNWASPSWDIFIVLFFILAVFLYGVSLGRDRVVVILVSVYMALALVGTLPGLSEFYASDVGTNFLAQVSVFVAFFIVLYVLLSRSVFANTFASVASGKWWQVFLFSIFHVGLLISSVLSFLPASVISHLAPLTQTVFATETARFAWLVTPIVSLIFVKAESDKKR